MTSDFWAGRQVCQNWSPYSKLKVYIRKKSDRGGQVGRSKKKEAKESDVIYGWFLIEIPMHVTKVYFILYLMKFKYMPLPAQHLISEIFIKKCPLSYGQVFFMKRNRLTLESEIVVPGTFIKFPDVSHQYFLISAGTFINLVVIRSCIQNSFRKCNDQKFPIKA